MITNNQTVRRRGYLVGCDWLQGLLSGGLWNYEFLNVPAPLNLPQTAKVCGMYSRPECHAVLLVVEDDSFDPVPLGSEIPLTNMVFTTIQIIKGDAQKRIDELEAALADLYHHYSLTSRAMQRIHEVLPQGDGPSQ